MINRDAPISFAKFNPIMKASYSVWLLVALKLKLRECLSVSPLGPSRMIPAPFPLMLEAPSMNNIQGLGFGFGSEEKVQHKNRRIPGT